MSKFQCNNKRQYSNKDEAREEIYRIITESYGGAVNLRYYKCKYCKKYHLTSNIK